MPLPHHLYITGTGFDADEFFYGCRADTADGPAGSGSRGVAPDDDGTSRNLNRPAYALAKNDEYLFEKITREIAQAEVLAGTISGGDSDTITVTPEIGSGKFPSNPTNKVYVGDSNYFSSQECRDLLVQLTDSDYNEIIDDDTGEEIKCIAIQRADTHLNIIGQDFWDSTDVEFIFNHAILDGTSYRLSIGAKTTVEDFASDALMNANIRGLHEAAGEAGKRSVYVLDAAGAEVADFSGTAALESALSVINSGGGECVLYLRAGVYEVSTPITANGVHIIGVSSDSSDGAIIRIPVNNTYGITGNNCSVKNVRFDFTGSADGTEAFILNGEHNCMENVVLENMFLSTLGSFCSFSNIECGGYEKALNTSSDYSTYNSIKLNHGTVAGTIWNDVSEYSTYTNVRVPSPGGATADQIGLFINSGAEENLYVGCTIYSSLDGEALTINGNALTFERCDFITSDNYAARFNYITNDNITFKNCSFTCANASCVTLSNTTSGVEFIDCSITSDAGAVDFSSGTLNNAVFQNCSFTGDTGDGFKAGDLNNVSLSNCTFSSTSGYALYSSGVDFYNIKISESTLTTGSASVVSINTCYEGSIENCTFSSTNGTPTDILVVTRFEKSSLENCIFTVTGEVTFTNIESGTLKNCEMGALNISTQSLNSVIQGCDIGDLTASSLDDTNINNCELGEVSVSTMARSGISGCDATNASLTNITAVVISECRFADSSPPSAALFCSGDDLTINACTIVSSGATPAVRIAGDNITITGSYISNNGTDYGLEIGGAVNNLCVTACEIKALVTAFRVGSALANCKVSGCTIESTTSGNGVYLSASTDNVVFDSCNISTANTSISYGFRVFNTTTCNLQVRNCTITSTYHGVFLSGNLEEVCLIGCTVFAKRQIFSITSSNYNKRVSLQGCKFINDNTASYSNSAFSVSAENTVDGGIGNSGSNYINMDDCVIFDKWSYVDVVTTLPSFYFYGVTGKNIAIFRDLTTMVVNDAMCAFTECSIDGLKFITSGACTPYTDRVNQEKGILYFTGWNHIKNLLVDGVFVGTWLRPVVWIAGVAGSEKISVIDGFVLKTGSEGTWYNAGYPLALCVDGHAEVKRFGWSSNNETSGTSSDCIVELIGAHSKLINSRIDAPGSKASIDAVVKVMGHACVVSGCHIVYTSIGPAADAGIYLGTSNVAVLIENCVVIHSGDFESTWGNLIGGTGDRSKCIGNYVAISGTATNGVCNLISLNTNTACVVGNSILETDTSGLGSITLQPDSAGNNVYVGGTPTLPM
ncbi:MAG: right-handed parallel beta-helix repeat-containing protein [Candidatus Hodarchaeales archaeon]|jgi:hypothetical protein